MRQALGWMMLVAVCWMGPAAAGEGGEKELDARLVEAQEDFDAAEKLKDAGGYAQALPRAEHALALRKSVLGSAHPDVASCLGLLGRLHRMQGNLTEAEPLLQSALDLREAALGKRHLDVAQSLSDITDLYLDQGRHDEARPLLERTLDIRREFLGERHPQVANSLNDLAVLHIAQANYDEAEGLLNRALDIRKEALGERHLDVAHTLNDLAVLFWKKGKYGDAKRVFGESLTLHEDILGAHHPDVAQLYSNAATLYLALGQFERAEPLFQRALDIYEAIPGHDLSKKANSLNNLAYVYMSQGSYSRAESLFKQALELRRETLGEQHHQFADSLNNLARLYLQQEDYNQAEPLLNRALALYEATLGPSHPSTAMTLSNLAALHLAQGRYDQARRLMERVRTLRKEVFTEHHPEYAHSLGMLASLYMAQGDYDRAEPFLEHALTLREQLLGESHPDSVDSLRKLAQLRLAQQRLDEALPLLDRALSFSEQRLHREALNFSESRFSRFLQSLRTDEETLYTLLRMHPQDARVQRLALRAALLLKGRSVEEAAQISRTLYLHLGAKDRDTLESLRDLRTQLSALSLAGPGALPSEDYQRRLKTLADEGDSLEADLARRSASLRALTGLISPKEDIVGRVAGSLPPDGVLVEYIAYAEGPLIRPFTTALGATPGPMRYLALVLFPDASIRAVDLGPKAPIDSAVSQLNGVVAGRGAAYLEPAQQLYQLVFEPLRPLLGTTRRLLLSPDGQLNFAPFAALHDGHAFLLDSFHLTQLTSGRELLPRPQDIAPSSSVVVLADPNFSASTPTRSAARDVPAPLPGTRIEAQGIQRLLPQARLFLGSAATKERLLSLPTPGILHIATHGFFLGVSPSEPGPKKSRAQVDSTGDSGPAAQQEPSLNSGLIMASVGAQAPGGPTPPVASSLVTALELAGLNLCGTQLVVLSACNTGRGEVQLGQGIYGLRRALVVAGAETVVMSLWKVNDDSTRLLMEAYYRNLLEGQGRTSALSAAMRSLRATHPHPYHWAPFIALGSDAPLRGIAPP